MDTFKLFPKEFFQKLNKSSWQQNNKYSYHTKVYRANISWIPNVANMQLHQNEIEN